MQITNKSMNFSQHELIFEHLPFAMAIISIENHQIVYINEKFSAFLAYQKEELIGRDIKDLSDFADNGMESVVGYILEKGECRHYEINFTDKKNHRHYGFLSGSLIDLHDLRYILISFDDMTEKLLNGREFNTPDTRFIAMLNNLPCIAWYKDLDGRYLAVNKPFMDFCGKKMEEILNRNDFSLWDAATAERLWQFDQYTLLLKSTETMAETFKTQKGMQCMEVINSPLNDGDGNICGITGIAFALRDNERLEEALIKSREKLEFTEDILNRSQELGKTGSFYYNITTQYLWWSYGVYSIFELSNDITIVKNTVDEFSVPDDRYLLEHLWKCMDSGLPYTFEHRISVKGRVKWIHVITSVQYASSGKPEAIIGTVMDITQKKQEEEAINKSREKLLFMEDTLLRSQQAGNVGSWLMDIKNNLIWGSEEAYRIFGAGKHLLPSAGEMISFILEKDREKVMAAWKEAIESEYFNVEFRIKKFGEIFWLQCKAMIEKDSTGQKVKAIGIISDITELKKAERELKKSEEKFRTVADWTYTWEYWLGPENTLLYISPSCERISGYTSEEFLTEPALLKSIIHPEDRGEVEKLCKSIDAIDPSEARKADVVNMEFRIIAKDNTMHWVEHTCRGVFSDEGEYLGLRVSNRDITQVKAAEELNRELIKAKEIDKLRTEFFANISHELRMPLTIIFSSLQLIQPVMDHEDMIIDEFTSLKKHYRYIRQNCYRLLKLVNNLIDITKIESGYMQPMLQQCDIVEVVRQIAMSVDLFVREKGLSLVFQSDTKELMVNSDPDKVERILLNLLSNAAKYNSPGGSITVRFKSKQDKYLIEVEDTGEGIEKSKQQDIFERFRQADNSFTRRHEGSGLGLSIVKMILDMLGGSIRVHSDAGSGSVFIVELPLDIKKSSYSLSQTPGLKWYPKVFSVNVEFSDIYS